MLYDSVGIFNSPTGKVWRCDVILNADKGKQKRGGKREEKREVRHPTYYTEILRVHRDLMNPQKSCAFADIYDYSVI